VILSENENKEEIILVGRGIAYGLSKGSIVIEDRIEKKFKLQDDVNQKFKKLIQDIPYNYVLISEKIIEYIKEHSTKEINDSIYVTLTDHIVNLIERVKMGIVFDSTLLLNIKSLYRDEYKLGLKSTQILKYSLNIDIDDSEANFIALHIINAELNSNMQQIYEITKIIEDILKIVNDEFVINDNDNISCDRFIVHCRFFAQRVINIEHLNSESSNDHTYQLMKKEYPKQSICISKISNLIMSKYHYVMSDDEKLYIMLHLIKLTT